MKKKALLLALFVAGLAASFAVGSAAGIFEGTTSTKATTGTTTGENEHGKKDNACHNVSFHGTAATPYLEKGEITKLADPRMLERINAAFGDGLHFAGFAFWFN